MRVYMVLFLTIVCSHLYCGVNKEYHEEIQNQSGRHLEEGLERNTTLSTIRISFKILDDFFSTSQISTLSESLIPSVLEFFSSALSIYPLTSPLIVNVNTCNTVNVPSEDGITGVAADVIIYIWSSNASGYVARAGSCQIDGGVYKRPLVGALEINLDSFFSAEYSVQIPILIHECMHILGFSSNHFSNYVKTDGSSYESSQYSVSITYPDRGKTVSALAFPLSLEKASKAFNCDIEGIELEDEGGSGTAGSHWDLRIMPHDLMAGTFTLEVVITDITLAMFEDSGWYKVDFSYSQPLYWGANQGCDWVKKKCIQNNIAKFPGICTDSNAENICDVFELGYGSCYTATYSDIPAYEQYFSDKTLGGIDLFDYCPAIFTYTNRQCRDISESANEDIGETRGINARCFMNTLLSDQYVYDNRNLQGGCYDVKDCNTIMAVFTIGGVDINCTFGESVSIDGWNGVLVCPDNQDFCRPRPCLNMCTGKGKCIDGVCNCKDGYGNNDCSLLCAEPCKHCMDLKSFCVSCYDDYALSNNECTSVNIQISISAPNLYSLTCPKLLTVQGNANSASFTWTATSSPNSPDLIDFIQKTTELLFTIPNSLLIINDFTITLTASSGDSISKNIVLTNSTYIDAKIDIGNSINIYANHMHTFKVQVAESECITGDLHYKWSYLSNNALDMAEIIANSFYPSWLVVPSHSFTPGLTYKFEIQVNDDYSTYFGDLVVNILFNDLVAVIDRGNGSAFVNDKLVISAGNSYDPDNPTADINYLWTCIEGNSNCKDIGGSVLIEDKYNEKIEISPGRLEAGKTYDFTVEIVFGNRITSKSVEILGASGSGGTINVVVPSTPLNNNFTISAFPIIVADESPSFFWTQTLGSSIEVSPSNYPYLFFKKNSFDRGNSYFFNLTMTVRSTSIYVEVPFIISPGPTCNKLAVELIDNYWNFDITCSHDDPSQFPLKYTFGVIRNSRYLPLKIYSSGSCKVKDTGDTNFYAKVCDFNTVCQVLEKSLEKRIRRLAIADEIDTELSYPDNLFPAILLNLDEADQETYSKILNLLMDYIYNQTASEIFEETLEYLFLVSSSNYTDPYSFGLILDSISYMLLDYNSPLSDLIVELIPLIFSTKNITDYSVPQNLIWSLNEKWMKNSIPGAKKTSTGDTSLLAARIFGNDTDLAYTISGISISIPDLGLTNSVVYDLYFTRYQNVTDYYLDIALFSVGTYESFSLNFSEKLPSNLVNPITVTFPISTSSSYKCTLYESLSWINKACKIVETTENSVKFEIDKIGMFSLIEDNYECGTGFGPIIANCSILLICVVGVIVFWCKDKGIEQKYSVVVYHPLLSICVKQPHRRIIGCLQVTSVLLSELAAIGALNLIFHEEFSNTSNGFTGFTIEQFKIGVIGICISQGISLLLVLLNQVDPKRRTCRTISFAISCFIILASSAAVVFMTAEFCNQYSQYWIINFLLILPIELFIFQSILWLVNSCIFKKKVEERYTDKT